MKGVMVIVWLVAVLMMLMSTASVFSFSILMGLADTIAMALSGLYGIFCSTILAVSAGLLFN